MSPDLSNQALKLHIRNPTPILLNNTDTRSLASLAYSRKGETYQGVVKGVLTLNGRLYATNFASYSEGNSSKNPSQVSQNNNSDKSNTPDAAQTQDVTSKKPAQDTTVVPKQVLTSRSGVWRIFSEMLKYGEMELLG